MQRQILQVIHSGGFYGAERMLADHCLALSDLIDTTVVLIGPSKELLQKFADLGVRCCECNTVDDLVQLARNKGALLNAHNFKAQVYAWLAAPRARIPLLFTQHGFTPRSLKQRLYMLVSIALCLTPRVRRVACVAAPLASLHRKYLVPSGKLVVIPNGLPQVRVPERDETRKLIGFVGRLSHEKGPDLFVQAVAPVLRRNPQIQAVMLGEGPMRAELEKTIEESGLSESFLMPGYQADMGSWLAQLSMLVISSRTEGTPMILLEAMQAGTPVVSFAVGGIPDVIRHGQEGMLAAPENVTQLSLMIEQALEDLATTRRMAEQARYRQQNEFSMEQNIRCWQQQYEYVLKEARI